MTRETLSCCVLLGSLSSLLAGCGGTGETVDGTGGSGATTTTGPGDTTTDPGATAGLGCGASEKPQANQELLVTSGGVERVVAVHLPPGYDPSTPAPLVLACHFQGGTPSSMNQATALDAAADAAGVVIAYPVGLDASFNAGKCCGKSWANAVDDVTFTRDALARLEATLCIDDKRIYAAGMSGGAMMAYRLGCEMADRLAGVASVAGAVHLQEVCQPSRAVPTLAIHGTSDELVPYDGGMGQPPITVEGDLVFGSVAQSIEPFRLAAACGDDTEETYQQGDATCVKWSSCQAGTTVERCTIDGGGHTWPSGLFPPVFGATSTDLNASEKILAFFTAHAGN